MYSINHHIIINSSKKIKKNDTIYFVLMFLTTHKKRQYEYYLRPFKNKKTNKRQLLLLHFFHLSLLSLWIWIILASQFIQSSDTISHHISNQTHFLPFCFTIHFRIIFFFLLLSCSSRSHLSSKSQVLSCFFSPSQRNSISAPQASFSAAHQKMAKRGYKIRILFLFYKINKYFCSVSENVHLELLLIFFQIIEISYL